MFNLSKNQKHYIVLKIQVLLILSFLLLNSSSLYANRAVISSCDKIPSDYRGKIFKIKTDYPSEVSNEERPWEYISFKEEPQKYAYTILEYIYIMEILIVILIYIVIKLLIGIMHHGCIMG